ncbi:MAG: NAD+ synthase [Candidatus Omnitrophota bacterium]|nr:MAG: NAD+ synthase [Candidatus Omnitrophota bacterium]
MIRLGIAQVNTIVGDFKGNANKIALNLETAEKYDLDILVFPELTICGYPPEDLLLKKHFIEANIEALYTLAKKITSKTVIIGFVDHDEKGHLYNACAVICNHKIIGVYRKMFLPNYAVFDEKRYFEAGQENIIFSKDRQSLFALSICEDIWVKNGPYVEQAKSGAQILINISASPYYAGKNRERKAMLCAHAIETQAFICFANLIGGQDELVFDGSSCIISPKGKIIAQAKSFTEDFIAADLNIQFQQANKKQITCKKINLPHCAQIDITKIHLPLKNNFAPKDLSLVQEIYQALVLGTKDYAAKNGFSKAVIGISGGIDSALTAIIAVDALGADNVVGVSLPSQYSCSETKLDAEILCKNLGIQFIRIPIQNIFTAYLSVLKDIFKQMPVDTTEENLQARIRGNILMALSNKFSWLVLATGNKSELSVGYCTLYGDMAGGFAVIKDVPKTLVYKLAAFRNQQQSNELIPQSIIKRPPSAELKNNQKDTDTLPDYSILDAILKAYIEENQKVSALQKSQGFKEEIMRKVIPLVDKNEYKRRQSPPGIRITPKAFGKDRRMPITHKFIE